MQSDDIHEEASQRSMSAKQTRQVEANDVKWLLSSKQGRRIVWRWLSEAGCFRTSFTGNSETFFREGKRAMGLFILGEINAHAPDTYALMQSEARTQTT